MRPLDILAVTWPFEDWAVTAGELFASSFWADESGFLIGCFIHDAAPLSSSIVPLSRFGFSSSICRTPRATAIDYGPMDRICFVDTLDVSASPENTSFHGTDQHSFTHQLERWSADIHSSGLVRVVSRPGPGDAHPSIHSICP